MEFPFNVNELLPDQITVVDETIAPFRGRAKLDRVGFLSRQAELKKVIDMMGEASAEAQNLRSPITSAMKLSHSDHRLYVSKDPSTNNGLGAVVGIIKIGYKKLFVLDYQGFQHEVNPLCILDFYVHESRQRTGCGKILFQHVIKMEGIAPHQFAIDRPSHKFLSFLKKHYGLDKAVPQVNHFVVFVEFFRDLQAVGEVSRHQCSLSNGGTGRPPVHPYKRPSLQNEYLLQRRQSANNSTLSRQSSADTSCHATDTETIQQVVHDNKPLKDISLPPIVPRPPGRHSATRSREGSAGSERWVLEASLKPQPPPTAERGMAARATYYSRHSLSREGSASGIRKGRQEVVGGEGDCSRVSSGGRRRNLHLTSAGNPFYVSSAGHREGERESQSASKPTDNNANQSTSAGVDSRFISSTGNYSVSQMYDTYFGKKTSFGTGWNVFGVSPGMNPSSNYPARKNQPRTFPH